MLAGFQLAEVAGHRLLEEHLEEAVVRHPEAGEAQDQTVVEVCIPAIMLQSKAGKKRIACKTYGIAGGVSCISCLRFA